MDKDEAIARAKSDMDADPYGTAMSGIKLLLRTAMDRNGAMSEQEFHNLKTLEEHALALDNSPPA